jgi:hypothetical protein
MLLKKLIPIFVKLARFQMTHMDCHQNNVMLQVNPKTKEATPFLIDFGMFSCAPGWELYDLGRLADTDTESKKLNSLVRKVLSYIGFRLYPQHELFRRGFREIPPKLTRHYFDLHTSLDDDRGDKVFGCKNINWRFIRDRIKAEEDERDALVDDIFHQAVKKFGL